MNQAGRIQGWAPATERLWNELVRAWPALALLAGLHYGALIAVPLALWFAGEHWLALAPLAAGAVVEAARLTLRQRIRRALRASCLAHAARTALDKVVPVPEANVDSAFWSAHMTEYAVAADAPAIAGAGAAVLTILAASWWRLGVALALPVTALLVAAGALLLWTSKSRGRAVESIVERREETASLLAAAERDFGEIHGAAARGPYLSHLTERARAWCSAEDRLERRQFGSRLSLGALVLAGLFAIALGQGLNVFALSQEASLTVRTVTDLLLLGTVLPVGSVLGYHVDSFLIALAALKKAEPVRSEPRAAGTQPLRRPSTLRARSLVYRYGSHPALAGPALAGPGPALAGPGPALALDIAELELDLGEPCLLMGPNGAGKTTFGALASGVFVPTAGSITLDGVEASTIDRDRLAFVPQNPLIVDTLSIAENIRLVAPSAPAAAMRERLLALGLDRALESPAGHLSKGEQRRIALARALLKDPALLVLDEPDAWLDAAGRQILLELLRAEASRRAILLISHRPDFAAEGFRVFALGADHRLASPPAAGSSAASQAGASPSDGALDSAAP